MGKRRKIIIWFQLALIEEAVGKHRSGSLGNLGSKVGWMDG